MSKAHACTDLFSNFRREKLQENLLKMLDMTTLPNLSTVTKPVKTEKAPLLLLNVLAD